MSTGGLALLLAEQTQPHTFDGLQTIGKVVYIIDLVIFMFLVVAITYRFTAFPGTFKRSIVHPTEGLFMATSLLSLASIIGAIARYGIPSSGPWLVVAYRVLFWIYFAFTFIFAVAQYCLLFTSPQLKIQDMVSTNHAALYHHILTVCARDRRRPGTCLSSHSCSAGPSRQPVRSTSRPTKQCR